MQSDSGERCCVGNAGRRIDHTGYGCAEQGDFAEAPVGPEPASQAGGIHGLSNGQTLQEFREGGERRDFEKHLAHLLDTLVSKGGRKMTQPLARLPDAIGEVDQLARPQKSAVLFALGSNDPLHLIIEHLLMIVQCADQLEHAFDVE